MRTRRFLFMLTVIALVLATVIPMPGSADRGLPKETPIPIMATPTPIPVVATPTPVLGILERLGYNEVPDSQEMEGFRRELLDLVDELDELSANVPHRPGQLSHAHSFLETARGKIQKLTGEELYMIQSSFQASETDFQAVKASVERVKSLVLTPGKETVEEDQFPAMPSPTPEEKQ